jgi:hypothetical protein
MEIGALAYPTVSRDPNAACSAPGAVDLTPALGNVGPLVSLLRRSGPSGSTPTAAALDVAASALLGVRAATRARALVLATDGAPDCNTALDPRTCQCVTGSCRLHPERCLDDARTRDRVALYASEGLPTYVIGIADEGDSIFSSVLDALAEAGGRPRSGAGHSYYAASSEEELELAIGTIRDQVAACTFLTTSVPSGGGTIEVTLDGQPLPYDSSGTHGWRWGNESNGEILLDGDTCSAVAKAVDPSLNATVTCSPPDAAADAESDAAVDADAASAPDAAN